MYIEVTLYPAIMIKMSTSLPFICSLEQDYERALSPVYRQETKFQREEPPCYRVRIRTGPGWSRVLVSFTPQVCGILAYSLALLMWEKHLKNLLDLWCSAC